MAGGGGGGKQSTTTEASYPPEFRPLAESAAKQIQALQQALPLASNAQFQPAGVAGLSPVQQFAINDLVMRTPYLPSTFDNLMQLPEPVGAASRGAVKAGGGSQGASGALDYLSGLLGHDVRPPAAPATTQPFQVLTRLPTPQTAFPGLSAASVRAAGPNIATQPTPMLLPIPPPPSLPPAPAPVAAPVDPALFAAQQARNAAALETLARLGVVPPPGVDPSEFLAQYMAANPVSSMSGGGNEGTG